MRQNRTDGKDSKVDYKDLPVPQRLYIDFTAVSGLMVDEAGAFTNVSVEKFARSIGVVRSTLYRWQDDIPEFWEKVRQRRPVLLERRVGVLYKGLTLRAAKGDAQQISIMLNQLEQLKPRVEKSEVTHIIPQPILGGKAEEPNGL